MSSARSALIHKSHLVCLLLGLVLTAFLSGCGSTDSSLGMNWKTYRNQRFGFEFLYPDRWVESIPPENRDGIAFGDPQNPGVEIRGWASYERLVSDDRSNRRSQPSLPSNFTTLQKVPGNLDAKIGTESSSLTLTLAQGETRYYWRGTAPNQQFENYYRFFNYIASRYRVPEK